jgi:siroheme synthase
MVHQADALYNLGVAYMLSGDYDNALATLTESQRVHADKATVETITECREAKAASSATAERERQAANEQQAEQASQQQRDDQPAKSVLTNDSVVKLVKRGLSEDVVVKMIAGQPAKFSLLPDDLLALKGAGVPDKVIAAMLDKK